MTEAGVKAFKVIKTRNGSKKVIGYYESYDKLRDSLDIQFTWGDKIFKWELPEPKRQNNNSFSSQRKKKGSSKNKSSRDSSRGQDSKKKKENTKQLKKGKKKSNKLPDKKDIRKLFTEILRSFLE